MITSMNNFNYYVVIYLLHIVIIQTFAAAFTQRVLVSLIRAFLGTSNQHLVEFKLDLNNFETFVWNFDGSLDWKSSKQRWCLMTGWNDSTLWVLSTFKNWTSAVVVHDNKLELSLVIIYIIMRSLSNRLKTLSPSLRRWKTKVFQKFHNLSYQSTTNKVWKEFRLVKFWWRVTKTFFVRLISFLSAMFGLWVMTRLQSTLE